MDNKFKKSETIDSEIAEKEITLSEEEVKQAKFNPFRADALKGVAKFAGVTVAMGLACKYTGIENLPYFNMALMAIEGSLSVSMVGNLVNYFNYKKYSREHKNDMSKSDFLNEQSMIYKTMYHQNKR